MSALCVSLFLLSDTQQPTWIGQHLVQEDLHLDNIIKTLLPNKSHIPVLITQTPRLASAGYSSTSDSILKFQQKVVSRLTESP